MKLTKNSIRATILEMVEESKDKKYPVKWTGPIGTLKQVKKEEELNVTWEFPAAQSTHLYFMGDKKDIDIMVDEIDGTFEKEDYIIKGKPGLPPRKRSVEESNEGNGRELTKCTEDDVKPKKETRKSRGGQFKYKCPKCNKSGKWTNSDLLAMGSWNEANEPELTQESPEILASASSKKEVVEEAYGLYRGERQLESFKNKELAKSRYKELVEAGRDMSRVKFKLVEEKTMQEYNLADAISAAEKAGNTEEAEFNVKEESKSDAHMTDEEMDERIVDLEIEDDEAVDVMASSMEQAAVEEGVNGYWQDAATLEKVKAVVASHQDTPKLKLLTSENLPTIISELTADSKYANYIKLFEDNDGDISKLSDRDVFGPMFAGVFGTMINRKLTMIEREVKMADRKANPPAKAKRDIRRKPSRDPREGTFTGSNRSRSA